MKPMICYPGGKHRMIPLLLQQIPDHCTYVEPFCGGAALFFSKQPAAQNVIADIDPELINFYHTLRDIPKEQLLSRLDVLWEISESTFYDYRDKVLRCRDHNSCLPNPDRAIIFMYINQLSYGCKGSNYGFVRLCKHCDYPRISKMIGELEEYHKLLKNADVIRADYKDSIRKYDSVCTFFYLDPPYYQPTDKIYSFHEIDPREVAAVCRSIAGKFILSYDNVPELFEIFNNFEIAVVDHKYSLGKYDLTGRAVKVKELLISNYDLKI